MPKTGKSFTLSKRDVGKQPGKDATETKQKKKKTKTGTTLMVDELPNYEFLPNPKNLPKVDKSAKSSWQQEMGMGQVTIEQIMKQEPQKEREEREMAEKPKEEIESSAQNEESEEKAHTSRQRVEETNMPPIQGEVKWKWLIQEHLSEINENPTGWDKMCDGNQNRSYIKPR